MYLAGYKARTAFSCPGSALGLQRRVLIPTVLSCSVVEPQATFSPPPLGLCMPMYAAFPEGAGLSHRGPTQFL